MFVSILIFLAILSVLVLIHEFGHFIVAKKLGIKVEEFGLGFPPRLFGKKYGETLFSFNLLPIGGFVKLHGEDAAGSGRIGGVEKKGLDAKRAYYARPPWQRAAVALAGVVMNLVLAIVIFYVFLSFSNFQTELPKLSDHTFYFTDTEVRSDVVVGQVAPDTPAADVGIESPSLVVSANGESITTSDQFVDVVQGSAGEEVDITFRNLLTQNEYTVAVTPRVDPPEGEGALGVALYSIDSYVLSFPTLGEKIFSGITYPLNLMAYNVNVIADLVQISVEERSVEPVGEGVSGPVGIFAVVNEIVNIPDARAAGMQILNIAGLLSISLAFFNILPIPALDGGRLAFIGIEKIFGRGISVKYESYAHAAGMVVLFGLLILITIRDIGRFF